MKQNNQIKTLINWAKKYMDCDTQLTTTIEGVEIKLTTEMVFNQIHLLIKVGGYDLDYYYKYDLDKDTNFKKVRK